MSVNNLDPHGQVETPASLADFAFVIVRIGLTSFGGGLSGWMLRLFVHERRWITETEFLSGLALCQVFPGVNVVNLAVWLGYRLHGRAGAIVGALAIIVPPAFVLIGIAAGFAELSAYHGVRTALDGVGAAAVGLSGAMGVRATRRSATGVVPVLLIVATCFSIAVLHWPLVPVAVSLAAVSVGLAFWRR